MQIKDKDALSLLKRARSAAVSESLELLPDDEIEGKTDIELVVDEIEYLVWMYEEDDTLQYANLQTAKKIMKETDNGEVMPVEWSPDDDIANRYSLEEIKEAKDTVNEYRRLKRLLKEYYKQYESKSY